MDAETIEAQDESSKEAKKRQAQVDPSIQCLSSRKVCKRKRLKGFDFCHKHILEDKNSPFQQCSFIIKSTDERCLNPAPKAENKKTFCLIHTRDPKLKKAHDEIMRRNMKRKIAHCKAVAEAKRSSQSFLTGSQGYALEPKRARDGDCNQGSAQELLEYGGIYALQDNGGPRYDVSWFGENDSDAESVDSEEEDLLRHAGVWTLEEALKICRDKMIRKRSLYLEQYKRLNFLLKKRKQLHLMRIATAAYAYDEDNETVIGNPMKLSEQKALGLYQHLNGIELLAERQGKEKRSRVNANQKLQPHNRCSFLYNMDRCEKEVLPLSKFCLQHICSDPDQRLYRKCTFEATSSDSCCSSPVLQVFRSTTCDLHAVPLPRFPSDALQYILQPENANENDSSDANMDTGLQGDTTQPMDIIEKRVQDQDILAKNSVLSNFDQNNMNEEKPGTAEQVDNKTLNLDVASKDPGNEEAKRTTIDDSSKTPFTSPYLKPIAANLNTRNTGEDTGTGPLAALKQKSDSSMGVEVNKSSLTDNFQNATVTCDGVKGSSAKMQEEKPDSCLESETGTKLELTEWHGQVNKR